MERDQDGYFQRISGGQCAGQDIRLVMQLLQDADHPLTGLVRHLTPVVYHPVDGPG